MAEKIKNSKKVRGKDTEFYVAIAGPVRARTVEQTLVVSGHRATFTVGGTPTAGNYVATVAGTAYTYAAAGTETNAQISAALAALVEADLTTTTETVVNGAAFTVLRDTTFAVSATAPNPGTLTASSVTATTPPVKGATTIPLLSALTSDLEIGQALLFETKSNAEYVAILSARAVAGATNLTVQPLWEAIPAGALAKTPNYLWNVTSKGMSDSYNLSESPDHNSGNARDGVIDGGSTDWSVPGNYNPKNAGALTLEYAARAGIEVVVEWRFPGINANIPNGEVYWQAAVVTSHNLSGEGTVTREFSLAGLGVSTKIDPT